ncbi:hypothetical protein ACFPRL_08465 [Pseudoclavibacter helvolus]
MPTKSPSGSRASPVAAASLLNGALLKRLDDVTRVPVPAWTTRGAFGVAFIHTNHTRHTGEVTRRNNGSRIPQFS